MYSYLSTCSSLNERSIDFGNGHQNGNNNTQNQRFMTTTARAMSHPGTAYANSLYFGYENINPLQQANNVNTNGKIYNTLATPLTSQSSTRIVNNTGTNQNDNSKQTGIHRNSTSSINRMNGDNHDSNSDYSPTNDNSQTKISPNNYNYKMNNSATNVEWSKLVQTATKAFESN